jgi:hypothetical protein
LLFNSGSLGCLLWLWVDFFSYSFLLLNFNLGIERIHSACDSFSADSFVGHWFAHPFVVQCMLDINPSRPTAWSAYQISLSAAIHAGFARLTTKGACKPVNLLPLYWKARGDVEIPGLVLNVVAVVAAAFFSWRLIKVLMAFC